MTNQHSLLIQPCSAADCTQLCENTGAAHGLFWVHQAKQHRWPKYIWWAGQKGKWRDPTGKLSYLCKWHDVLLDVRFAHGLRLFIVIRYHNVDGGIVETNAVDQIFEFVVAQKSLGGNGNKSADIILCKSRIIIFKKLSNYYTLDNNINPDKPVWCPEL